MTSSSFARMAGISRPSFPFCGTLYSGNTPSVLPSSWMLANDAFPHLEGGLRCIIFDNEKAAVKNSFGAHVKKQAGYAVLSPAMALRPCPAIRLPATNRNLQRFSQGICTQQALCISYRTGAALLGSSEPYLYSFTGICQQFFFLK